MGKAQKFSKYGKLPLLWPRIVSLWLRVEKLSVPIILLSILQNEENELKTFLF